MSANGVPTLRTMLAQSQRLGAPKFRYNPLKCVVKDFFQPEFDRLLVKLG